MTKTLLFIFSASLICSLSPLRAQDETRISFYAPGIVRVEKGGAGSHDSFSVVARPEDVSVKRHSSASATTYSSSELRVVVDKASGAVSFALLDGAVLLKEGKGKMVERLSGADKGAYIVSQSFLLDADEPIYGLGILQDGQLSLRGKHRYMIQGNQEDFVPIVQSVKGYGIFWDNPSPTTFDDGEAGMSFTSEVGGGVDYYFIYGGDADGVVAGIRQLTGQVPMLPLWSYGFMQSRERYKSTSEVLGVLANYRKAGIPLDGMIQDWQYWGSNYLWNAMEFLDEGYKDAQSMIDQVHASDAHLMISIWSSFGPMTKGYREMSEAGHLMHFLTWPRSGSTIWPPKLDYPSGVLPYDPFSAEARDIYWTNLKRLFDMGIDAWWMDSTEPDHEDFKDGDLEEMTSAGSFRSVRNAYPLATVGGVFEHNRKASDDHRVCILTRSAFAGQQRTGANTWSGDIQSTWETLRHQVPAGLGFALTGNPNFNTDIGGFFANAYNDKGRYGSAVANPRFRELYVRWMQYGAFSPMMRSHGTEVPREIYLYGKQGEPVYDALVSAVKLRYSLLPYIYSTAWQVSDGASTFQRALMMDFPEDRRVWNMGDEYMFGDALLVAPVLKAQFTSEERGFSDEKVDFSGKGEREVYLPAGADWYDFHTEAFSRGGQTVRKATSLDTIPMYVRAGSIVPIGPDVQFASVRDWDSLEIRIYAGSDGFFTLYDDEGDGYGYEKGLYSAIPFTLRGRTLSIGGRQGSIYEGMTSRRHFHLVFISPDGGRTASDIEYTGERLKIKF